MTEQNNSWTGISIKNGVILGSIVGILGVIIQMFTDPTSQSMGQVGISLLFALVGFGLSLYFNYASVKTYRDELNGGWVTLGRAFLIGLLMYFVADMVSSLFSFIYFSFLMPESTKEAMQALAEQSREAMEEAGSPEFLINMSERAMGTILNPITVFVAPFIYLIWNALKAVIMAAVMKKDQPIVAA